MKTIRQSIFRQLEKHGLRCIYGYNHSKSGYTEPATITFSFHNTVYQLDESSFISSDYKLLAKDMLEATSGRALGTGLNFNKPTARHDIDGATEMLRCIAEIDAGLLKVVEDI